MDGLTISPAQYCVRVYHLETLLVKQRSRFRKSKHSNTELLKHKVVGF